MSSFFSPRGAMSDRQSYKVIMDLYFRGAAAPTAQGSDSYTYIHMKKDLEPVTRRGEKGDKLVMLFHYSSVDSGLHCSFFL